MKVCVACALFGSHKNHDVREIEMVLREVKNKADAIQSQFDKIRKKQDEM